MGWNGGVNFTIIIVKEKVISSARIECHVFNCVHDCKDHSSFDFTSAVHI